MRGTQAIVEILAAEGIPFVVAYPGLGNESIISALVINVMGDGAFGMTGMDIETAVRLNIPILCIKGAV